MRQDTYFKDVCGTIHSEGDSSAMLSGSWRDRRVASMNYVQAMRRLAAGIEEGPSLVLGGVRG